MRFKVVVDTRFTLIERKVYTYYDMLGQIGGFIGIILGLGSIISGFFSDRIFMMTLMTNLFKVDTPKKR